MLEEGEAEHLAIPADRSSACHGGEAPVLVDVPSSDKAANPIREGSLDSTLSPMARTWTPSGSVPLHVRGGMRKESFRTMC